MDIHQVIEVIVSVVLFCDSVPPSQSKITSYHTSGFNMYFLFAPLKTHRLTLVIQASHLYILTRWGAVAKPPQKSNPSLEIEEFPNKNPSSDRSRRPSLRPDSPSPKTSHPNALRGADASRRLAPIIPRRGPAGRRGGRRHPLYTHAARSPFISMEIFNQGWMSLISMAVIWLPVWVT